jgi:hypothetical protein
MGEFVAAGLLSHVPTIMLPEATRREINEGKELSLVTSLRQLRKDVFETLDYDTVIVLDSHWFTTVEFIITSHARRAGLFTAENCPRHVPDVAGDPGSPTPSRPTPTRSARGSPVDDRYLPLYYPHQPVVLPAKASTSSGCR